MTTVIRGNWFDPFGMLCSEIGSRQIAATRIGGGDDLLGKLAFVKQLAAVLSNSRHVRASFGCRKSSPVLVAARQRGIVPSTLSRVVVSMRPISRIERLSG